MMRFSRSNIISIFDEHQGVSLEISFNDEISKSTICIQPSADEHSQDYYKGMKLDLGDKQQARIVAHAILDLASQMEGE